MDHGPIDRKAPRERTHLDDTSWVDVVRGFASDTEATFERLVREVDWHQNRMIRGGRMVDDPRLDGMLSRARAEADDPADTCYAWLSGDDGGDALSPSCDCGPRRCWLFGTDRATCVPHSEVDRVGASQPAGGRL